MLLRQKEKEQLHHLIHCLYRSRYIILTLKWLFNTFKDKRSRLMHSTIAVIKWVLLEIISRTVKANDLKIEYYNAL